MTARERDEREAELQRYVANLYAEAADGPYYHDDLDRTIAEVEAEIDALTLAEVA